MNYCQEYFCTHCGAILNVQDGFDPDGGNWVCKECGQMLYGEGVYDGDIFPSVMWYCDKCGAFLNRQTGFKDNCRYWTCTECGHMNPVSEEEIHQAEEQHSTKVEKIKPFRRQRGLD